MPVRRVLRSLAQGGGGEKARIRSANQLAWNQNGHACVCTVGSGVAHLGITNRGIGLARMAGGPTIGVADSPGEMAARVAAYDWAATPLGPRERWSPSLRLIVETILASRFPMALRWGPEFVLIYNDGYAPILGDKHPRALGLPFSQTWPEVKEQLAVA